MVNIWPIIDQVLGTRCALCQAPGEIICASCEGVLPRNRPACARCALPLPQAAAPETLCADCLERAPAFDRVVAPLLYLDPVDLLVTRFKSHGALHLGPALAGCIAAQRGALTDTPLLLPMPADPRRLRRRGFNPPAELAACLAGRLGLAYSTGCLLRRAGGTPQHGLNRRQRRRNVRGVFRCERTVPDTVVLIDDVVTTGATADEASRVLKRAGARRVEIWAIARTPRDRWST